MFNIKCENRNAEYLNYYYFNNKLPFLLLWDDTMTFWVVTEDLMPLIKRMGSVNIKLLSYSIVLDGDEFESCNLLVHFNTCDYSCS